MAEGKPSDLNARRRRGKTARLLKGATHVLEELEPGYQDYVRWHRLVYEVDPDPGEVSNQFPVGDEDGE